MTIRMFDSTNQDLMLYPWADTDNTYYLQLVNSEYVFDSALSDTFNFASFSVEDRVELTGRTLKNSVLKCDSIELPESIATYAVIYVNNKIVFYIDPGLGVDAELNDRFKLELDFVLSTTQETTTTTSTLIQTPYDGFIDLLYSLDYTDQGNIFSAQLVNEGYTFNAAHSTRRSIRANAVGNPVVLSGKTVRFSGSVTTIDCSNPDFTTQGTLDAAGMVIASMPIGSTDDSDPLLTYIDFVSVESVDRAIPLNSTGLARITRA